MTESHNTTGQLINEEELDPDHNNGHRNTERTEELDGAQTTTEKIQPALRHHSPGLLPGALHTDWPFGVVHLDHVPAIVVCRRPVDPCLCARVSLLSPP